jgi:hypothetical protein
VWAVIGDFDDIRRWAPGVSAQRVEGTGAQRARVLLLGEHEVTETLVAEEPLSYTYRVSAGGRDVYTEGTVAVVPLDDGSSRIELTNRYPPQPDADPDEVATGKARFLRGNLKAMQRALGTTP